mmetsp:Transcript_11250/g.24850  ORF Transcript_11250/g.24850 Transcript_11250/m.24850 type:complete len:326 (-) Transcript_11250:112-1089(-)|eukprot:CAMPEP_0204352870 /NCGR_PEP_ID=MMETSP0469-20131031/32230_1 /ASSEMBLY_ACC=CAM_ASM_000384 /TAXON_ID=2969 /ORGANISM="Oxyrrhis marina" /LENGTH=325 /DNA_ID=CAMNT_0051339685 /DNA_START=20 /DNA_END=997 /DNA_ORIENTATION=-
MEPWCRHLGATDEISCVGVVGGTHGNERNGVFLGRSFGKIAGPPGGKHGCGFELFVTEANVEATKKNLRYTEEDLNRCFLLKDLNNPEHNKLYEHRRAKEINALLGPKDSPTPKCDFIFDLHNTTAATGVCLLMHPRDTFAQEIAAYLISIDPSVVVVTWNNAEVGLLPSVGRSGMTFEVGPVPTGCMHAEQYLQSEKLLKAAFKYIEAHNAAAKGAATKRRKVSMQVFLNQGMIKYPRDASGEIAGVQHAAIQYKDFQVPLEATTPVFTMFDGTEKTMADVYDKPTEGLYPFFVNEAAYVEKDIAFSLCKKSTLEVSVLQFEEN